MPFDGTTITPTDRCRILIEALRSPMPPGFGWNFRQWYYERSCGHAGCACGLALEIGVTSKIASRGSSPATHLGRAIGISPTTAMRIFCPSDTLKVYGVEDLEKVTPAMVADALERVLLKREKAKCRSINHSTKHPASTSSAPSTVPEMV